MKHNKNPLFVLIFSLIQTSLILLPSVIFKWLNNQIIGMNYTFTWPFYWICIIWIIFWVIWLLTNNSNLNKYIPIILVLFPILAIYSIIKWPWWDDWPWILWWAIVIIPSILCWLIWILLLLNNFEKEKF